MKKGLEIAIDFDGTCVTHEYPNVGKDIGAQEVLRKLIDRGDKLILYTMRSSRHLDDAVEWFRMNGIPLHGVQYNPHQTQWTSSNKCYAQLYIDDAALGCPLKQEAIYGEVPERPYVDWGKVEQILFN